MLIEFLEFAIRGALLGAIYGLLAFPVSLLFVTTDSVDLAVGAYAVLAAAVAAAFAGPLGIVFGVLSAVAASLVVAGLSLRAETGHAKDPLTVVLITFGISVFLESFVLTVFGQNPMVRQAFDTFWVVGPLRVSPQAAINVAIGVALLLTLYVWLNFTAFGRDMRACAVSATAAALAGIPVDRIHIMAHAIGGLLAGIAGILILYTTGTSYSAGLGLTISGFGAAAILGLHSPLRGFFGGVAIGTVEAVATGYLPPGLGTAAPLIFILLVLARGKANIGQPAGGRA
jgi:branched-subunit amino acid ABC-type transport system permease component